MSKGCQNHGCLIEEPKGMATNGPCRCLDGLSKENKLVVKRALAFYRKYAPDRLIQTSIEKRKEENELGRKLV